MSGNQEIFQKAMNQGHSAAWDQQWDQAARYYEEALEEFPEDTSALMNLGLALYQQQDYQAALAFYEKAAELCPDDPLPLEKAGDVLELLGSLNKAADVFMRVAETYAKNRDIQKAIDSWKRVTQINPAYYLARSRLALVYERMGKRKEAVRELIAIASLLQHAREIQKAVQIATHALQLVPDSDEAGQALAYLRTGQPLPKISRPGGDTGPLVRAQLKEMQSKKEIEVPRLSIDPVSEARQKAMSELASLIFEGEEEETPEEQAGSRRGMQAIIKGMGLGSNKQLDRTRVVLHLSQAVDLQSRGHGSQAVEDLERAVDAGLEHPAAYFDLGLLCWEGGKLESAIRHLQKSVHHTDYALGARLLSGQVYQKMGQMKEAAVEYMEALRIADSLAVPNEVSEALRKLYDPLVEMITESPADSYVNLCRNIEELLLQPGWHDKMARARKELPVTNEGEPPVPLAEVMTESQGGKVVEAISRVHQLSRLGLHQAAMEEAYFALQNAPTYLPLHTYIGELLLEQHMTQHAMQKFTAVARAYSVRGQPRRSIEMYQRIIDLDPMDMKIRNQLIEQLAAMGHYEDAVLEYMKLADLYYNLADPAAARKTNITAMKLAQQTNVGRELKVKLLHRMADIEMQSLDWRQAIRIYEQTRSLQPDDEEARSNLIDLHFRLNQNNQALTELDDYITYMFSVKRYEAVLQFVETLNQEYPKQPGIRRRLAELYRQAGRPEDAIQQLDAAGELLLEAGDKREAAEAVMAILALNPPNADDYRKLLDQIRTG